MGKKLVFSFILILNLASCATFNSPIKGNNFVTSRSHVSDEMRDYTETEEETQVSEKNLLTQEQEPEGETPPEKEIALSDLPHNESSLFSWPVPEDSKLTQHFSAFNSKKHYGVDIANKLGAPIKAAHDGLVVYTGRAFNGYGKLIIIENANGWSTFYSHCQKILVREGQKVKRLKLIAKMGRTGRATGVHLHFELRKDGTPVDPLKYLP